MYGADARFAVPYVDPKVSDDTEEEVATYDARLVNWDVCTSWGGLRRGARSQERKLIQTYTAPNAVRKAKRPGHTWSHLGGRASAGILSK